MQQTGISDSLLLLDFYGFIYLESNSPAAWLRGNVVTYWTRSSALHSLLCILLSLRIIPRHIRAGCLCVSLSFVHVVSYVVLGGDLSSCVCVHICSTFTFFYPWNRDKVREVEKGKEYNNFTFESTIMTRINEKLVHRLKRGRGEHTHTHTHTQYIK